ncbi:DNA segregation ATPase FtsK/SpoIIIE, S-DNA-T family [Promicromonospora umidemergens]|uniref:FtsK domain-containing protein n=1 Tax=Promicromonospora umidemergens TaxID=629679 RepID=A0ABP8WDS9_9MICO|nr:FtsK/SpoIIIE domain-containing protein [Promicromonospora umidemergens]MCP2284442.1 DNA segregation ATPase FtsK/SpoIIIE, S-DNA-T family [Promicromonospora umidemergens]
MTRPPSSDGAVRMTLHPGEDVLLRPGTRLADLRAPLATLTRRPELRYAALTVDGVPVTDDRVVGERPLLPGAVLRVRRPGRSVAEPAPGPALRSAAARPWLVARVTGPDAGTAVGADGPLAALRTWARLRPGGRLAVRRTRGPAAWLAPRPTAPPGGVPWMFTLLPAAASLALAAALRQPLLAVFALVGLVMALPQLRAALQRATTSGTTQVRSRELPGPSRLLAFAHAALHVSPGAWAAAREAHAAARTPGPAGNAGAAVHLLPTPPDDPWEQLLHDGSVAVLGPGGLARSVARALVAGRAARGATVQVGDGAPGWSWVRWLPEGGPLVLVLDSTADPWADHPPGGAVPVPGAARTPEPAAPPAVDLVVSVGTVPPGCRAVARVLDDRRVRITGPDGAARTVPLVGVTTEWAEHLARLLAGAARLGRTAAGHADGPQLPAVVPLTRAHGLTEVPAPRSLAARWSCSAGWAVPLGVGADGAPVCLDLVRDGPHLLVAGTTGSGKSELLQTLVLGLALTRSPADLALVLVDFKGGASLGACPGLPHVVGQVTDLEPGLAGRALAGLRAELRRRERILAAHAVPDVAVLPPGTLPRLVVVIDEFRALADDLPEFLPGLLRVAAQGRSLGVHLVLATQRPGGAVGPDLRANVSARLALRVTDPLESRDVLDDPAAARIPATSPGRAVLRLGSAPPVPLQCAHATTPPEAEMPPVRRAPAWPAGPRGPGVLPAAARTTPGPRGHSPGSRLRPGPPDVATLVVDAARRAAGALGHEPGVPPWLPQLPRRAGVADLPLATRRDRAGLVLALGDDPERQRRTTVTWDPCDGHLAIVGRARSGRTTALVTLALGALRLGWAVHGITRDPAELAPLAAHPGYGGTVRPDDAEAVARLLAEAGATAGQGAGQGSGHDARQRAGRADEARTLVLVDGVEDARATVPPGALRSEVAFALTADTPSMGGLASRVGPRLVLLGTDRAADVVLGAPVAVAGSGGPPGRAAWCGRGDPVLCQVLEPGVSPRSRSPTSLP